MLPRSSETVMMQPLNVLAELFPTSGRDFDSLTELIAGWSVIKPSTTRISLSSLVLGINCVIQLFRRSNTDTNIICSLFIILNLEIKTEGY
jgi:hypothetical protein